MTTTMPKTEETAAPVQLWITFQEVAIIFDKGKSTVQYAIWRSRIRARQSLAGTTWLVEYYSCVAFWGEPVFPNLVDVIKEQCYGRI